jgi:hypothetical protein
MGEKGELQSDLQISQIALFWQPVDPRVEEDRDQA